MSHLEEGKLLFITTATTGPTAAGNEVLSISITDHSGAVRLHTLIKPVHLTTWPTEPDGPAISPADVLPSNLPTLAELAPLIGCLVAGQHVIIYNAPYQTELLAAALRLGPPASVHCVKEAFGGYYSAAVTLGKPCLDSLRSVAQHVLYRFSQGLPNTLDDSFALRAIWHFLNQPAMQRAVSELITPAISIPLS